MNQSFRIDVYQRQISQILLELTQVEGIEVQIATSNAKIPDPTRLHPDYNLSISDLAGIVIALTGAITSWIALATVIFQYRLEKAEALKSKTDGQKQDNEPSIVINQLVINISDFSNAEELAKFLEKEINQTINQDKT